MISAAGVFTGASWNINIFQLPNISFATPPLSSAFEEILFQRAEDRMSNYFPAAGGVPDSSLELPILGMRRWALRLPEFMPMKAEKPGELRPRFGLSPGDLGAHPPARAG